MIIFRIDEKFNLLFLLIQLSIVIANKSRKFCDTKTNCDNCIFCGIDTQNNNNQCSFENLFCLKEPSKELFFNKIIFHQYKLFLQNYIGNSKISTVEEINLDTLTKSFDIIKITNKDNKNLNKTHFYCLITNSKYLNNKKDSAFLSIEYNLLNNIKEKNLTKNILFYVIFENTKTTDSLILNDDDKKIRNLNWKTEINDYDKILILLEFHNNNIFENDDDYFEVKIKTKNVSIIRRKIIIIITCILIIILALIIFPCIIYSCLRKKKLNEKIKRELDKEKNKNDEIFQKMFGNILVKTELSSKYIIKNCPVCVICLQTFILKCSICFTPCKHVFHYECLKKFAETKKNDISALKCPLCNFIFFDENLRDNSNAISSNRNFNVYSKEQCKIAVMSI